MALKLPITTLTMISALMLCGCPDDTPLMDSSGSAEGSESAESGSSSGGVIDVPTASSSGMGSGSVGSGSDSADSTDGTDGSESTGSDPVCGNGELEGDEECDDGGESATCDSDCTAAECGDSVLNEMSGELCDEGGRTMACNADCTLASCGDSVLNMEAGEECDDGGESPACNIDCTIPMCGDGVVNMTAGENCDDGGESATCDLDCTPAMCGDTTINMVAGETCDDAGQSATCDLDCTEAMCGDGVFNVMAGEECDFGGESATCDADCTDAICGDGTLNVTAGETCDDGGESAMCDLDCTASMCGDGVLNTIAGEQCDDGNMVDDDGCSNSCSFGTSATCAQLLTNDLMWGIPATGVDLIPWTSSTLHWIGCTGNGCLLTDFYCNDDPVAQTIAFGVAGNSALRSMVDPGNVLGNVNPVAVGGCCSAAAPNDICNAPDSLNNGVPGDMIGALCTALGYSSGMVVRQEANNFCPEPHTLDAAAQQWDSDFVQSNGFGAEYLCTGFL